MAFKAVKFELKSLDEAGSFTGMASVFGVTDLGGDVVEPGAFQKTLLEKGGTTPLLWSHKMDEVVGVGRLSETREGLQVEGKLIFDDNPTARRTYALMKAGAVRGLSIGYDVVRHAMKNGTRVLQELKLHEISLTPFPMCEQAMITELKQTVVVDHTAELRAINQLRQTIRKALR